MQSVASIISRTTSLPNVIVRTNLNYYPSYKLTNFHLNNYTVAIRVKRVTSRALLYTSLGYIYPRFIPSDQSASDKSTHRPPTANQRWVRVYKLFNFNFVCLLYLSSSTSSLVALAPGTSYFYSSQLHPCLYLTSLTPMHVYNLSFTPLQVVWLCTLVSLQIVYTDSRLASWANGLAA